MVSGPSVAQVVVEVQSSTTALPSISLIGLPRGSTMESKDRVFSALRTLRVSLPRRRLVISLTPVEIPKNSAFLDLPIALAVLAVFNIIPQKQYVALGELGLDGTLRSSPQTLALCASLLASNQLPSGSKIIVPKDALPYLCRFSADRFLPAIHLREVVALLRSEACSIPFTYKNSLEPQRENSSSQGKMSVSAGLLRVVSLAVAGSHHTLLYGSPGVGKSHSRILFSRLWPDPDPALSLERAIRASIQNEKESLSPLVFVHSQSSLAGLLGGGIPLRSGAVTHADKGILFLDEAPEFSRECLESLRQPLEEGQITLWRGGQSWCLPTDFLLVTTANPCPCGYYGEARCRCRLPEIQRYVGKLSGPLLDRIDIQWRTTQFDRRIVETNEWRLLRDRIAAALEIQRSRASLFSVPLKNSRYEESDFVSIGDSLHSSLLEPQIRDWSLRRRLKLWRVARTIADFEMRERWEEKDLIEAYQLVGSRLNSDG